MATEEKDQPELENDYFQFESTTPLPVADGLKAQSQWGDFTRSWWAGRWLKALTQFVSPSRLVRAKAYARLGQVMELDVQVGLVLARVQGTQPSPYRVRVEFKVLDDAEWERGIQAMASQAIYAAQLLNGEMPHEIEDVFHSVGVSLFPQNKGDLVTQCTCPDWANPCKHIIAACLLLGERLDSDPFLLFLMRGRAKEQIMATLRTKRADHATGPAPQPRPQVSLFSAPVADRSLEETLDTFWQMGEEAQSVQVHVAAPQVEMEVLRMLGDPSFAEDEAIGERLAEVYRAVSRKALDVAFGEQ
jgi:uncharacterized Zn finger protein